MPKNIIGLLLLVSSVIFSTIAALHVPRATGQDVVAGPADRQLALARICASEEGLSRSTEGCAAIDAVISHRARMREVSWMRQARDGSSQSFNTRRSDMRRWIAFLNPDGTQPDGWPSHAWRRVMVPGDDGVEREMLAQVQHAPWSMPDRRDDFQRRWLRIHERAGAIVRGEENHQCRLGGRREEPAYWGCPPDDFIEGSCRDHARAERAGWVRLDCGETARNWFYCDPRESRSCVRQPEVATTQDPSETEHGTEELLGG
jgi:hypothetical protein